MNQNQNNEKSQVSLLRKAIGKELISIEHVEPRNGNEIFLRVRFNIQGTYYTLDNSIIGVDNFFGIPDEIPNFVFVPMEKEDTYNLNLKTYPIKERITDVYLIQDHVNVLKNGKHYQEIDSTEGVVFETQLRQYGFFKENTWMDESMLFFRGQNVISKMESIEKHWSIFNKPLDADILREQVSLKDGTKSILSKAFLEGNQ